VSGSLIDANVLLDIATADQVWMPWSQGQLSMAAGRGAIFVNPIIYAERGAFQKVSTSVT
jgi:hypothetical protein